MVVNRSNVNAELHIGFNDFYPIKLGGNRPVNAFVGHIVGPGADKADNFGVGGGDDNEKEQCLHNFDDVFFEALAGECVIERGGEDGDEQDDSADSPGLGDKEFLKVDKFIDYKVERIINGVAEIGKPLAHSIFLLFQGLYPVIFIPFGHRRTINRSSVLVHVNSHFFLNIN